MKKSKKSEKCSKEDNVIELSDYQKIEVIDSVENEGYISLEFEDELIEKMGVDLTEEDIKQLADSLVNSIFGNPDEEN
jgi:hypothetical protein|tara:strand:+ start:375 stop:608 length:234 start_codon:yes stop_codon:yes gene_type:complete